jgi:hypothetical protein
LTYFLHYNCYRGFNQVCSYRFDRGYITFLEGYCKALPSPVAELRLPYCPVENGSPTSGDMIVCFHFFVYFTFIVGLIYHVYTSLESKTFTSASSALFAMLDRTHSEITAKGKQDYLFIVLERILVNKCIHNCNQL